MDQTYTRDDVMRVVGLSHVSKGGNWFTGYTSYDGVHFIFCNIGVAGRTGHDYQNYFDGDDLIWSGKTGSCASHPSIMRMVAQDAETHIFYRRNQRDPFTYGGLGCAAGVGDEVPVRVRWRLSTK